MMTSDVPFYLQKLKEAFDARRLSSASYSLRAFARDLEFHPSTLSQILLGRRPLSLQLGLGLVKKLNLSPVESTLFFDSLEPKTKLDEIRIDPDPRFILDDSYFSVIAEWEHYAALTLMDLPDFDLTPGSIAERLNVSHERSVEVIENLEASNLIEVQDSKFVKTVGRVRTTEDSNSEALRQAHIDTLKVGMEKIDLPSHLRDYSSVCVAVDLETIPEAKGIIREFRQKMMALFKTGKKTDVYQLAIQLYPLTNPEGPVQ